jgi:hypothetical protein
MTLSLFLADSANVVACGLMKPLFLTERPPSESRELVVERAEREDMDETCESARGKPWGELSESGVDADRLKSSAASEGSPLGRSIVGDSTMVSVEGQPEIWPRSRPGDRSMLAPEPAGSAELSMVAGWSRRARVVY